jgi:hypothetical protein
VPNCVTAPGGWAYPSEQMMEFASWDDDIPNIYIYQLIWKVIKFHGSSHHQAGTFSAHAIVDFPRHGRSRFAWTSGATPGFRSLGFRIGIDVQQQ